MKRTVDTSDYLDMCGRTISAAGRRVAESDVETLPELLQLHELVDVAAAAAVAGLRDRGWTWQSIGDALGVTRQAAIQRWPQT